MNTEQIMGLTAAQWAEFDVRRDYLTPEVMDGLVKQTYKACHCANSLRLWTYEEAHNILVSAIYLELGGALQSQLRHKTELQGRARITFLEGVSQSIISTRLARTLASEAPINLAENADPDLLSGVSRCGHDSRMYASLGEAVIHDDYLTGEHGVSPELALQSREEAAEEHQRRSDLVEYARPFISEVQYVYLRQNIVEGLPVSRISELHNTNSHAIRACIRRACHKLLAAVAEGRMPASASELSFLFAADPRLSERLRVFLLAHPEHTHHFAAPTPKVKVVVDVKPRAKKQLGRNSARYSKSCTAQARYAQSSAYYRLAHTDEASWLD